MSFGSAQANCPGPGGSGSSIPRACRIRTGRGAPEVVVGARPGGERDAAVLLEDPAGVAQRRLGVLEQHVAPAAQDAVEARRGLVDRHVHVDLAEADVRRCPCARALRCAAASISGAKSLVISVPPGWISSAARNPVSPIPAARSSTRVPGLGRDRVDHPGRHRHRVALPNVSACFSHPSPRAPSTRAIPCCIRAIVSSVHVRRGLAASKPQVCAAWRCRPVRRAVERGRLRLHAAYAYDLLSREGEWMAARRSRPARARCWPG